MDLVILFCAKYLVFIIVLLAFLYWLYLNKAKKIQMLIFGVIIALLTFIFTRIAGALYYNPRPFVDSALAPIISHAPNNGFPSDHTALAFVVALSVFYMNKKIGVIFILLASLVGFSRFWGNIHSIEDIFGSIIFASIAYVIAFYLTPKLLQFVKKP